MLLRAFQYILHIEEEVDTSSPPVLQLEDFTINFPADTDNNGIVFEFIGTKPADFTINQATLYLEGNEFWSKINDVYNPALVSAVKLAWHPVQLVPSRMSKRVFKKNETRVTGCIQLCTGLKKERSVPQPTIRDGLRKIIAYGDTIINFKVVYYSKKAKKRRGILFQKEIRASELLNLIRRDYNLREKLRSGW